MEKLVWLVWIKRGMEVCVVLAALGFVWSVFR